MPTAQELLKTLAPLKARSTRFPHPWEKYADMIGDMSCDSEDWKGTMLHANAFGFDIPVADGEFSVTFAGGMTQEQWDYFSPLLDEWSKTVLAKGILQNLLRPNDGREWDEALEPLQIKHGRNEEEWLPQLVNEIGFDAIAHEMAQAIFTFRQRTPAPSMIVKKDSTGLWHSSDYRICKDIAGTVYNCTPVVAKLIEVLNLALKQGIPEMNGNTLLNEALKLSSANASLASQIKQMLRSLGATYRPDHSFSRCGVWKTLVCSGVRKGCYRLFVDAADT